MPGDLFARRPSAARRIARTTLRVLAGTAGTVLALAALAAVYYQFDDPLSQDAQKLLATRARSGEASEENGYIALLGMGAPAGQDQMTWGRKVFAALRVLDTDGVESDAELEKARKAHLPVPPGSRWCTPGKDCTVASFRSRQPTLERMLEDNQELMQRYRFMRAKAAFEEVYVPSTIRSPLADTSGASVAANLARFAIFARADRGDATGALDELEQEIAFHARMALGSRTLLAKVRALHLLAQDALTVSDLLTAYRDAMSPHAERIGAMLARFDGRLELRRAMVLESAAFARFLLGPVLGGSLMESAAVALFYRPHQTVNAYAAAETERLAALDAGALRFDAASAKLHDIDRRFIEPGWLDFARNPLGTAVLMIGWSTPQSYYARVHDLTALARLVSLQAALMRRNAQTLADADEVFAADGGRRFADPYTGKPFAFDAAAGTIHFEARGKGGWQAELTGTSGTRVALRTR